MHLWKRVQCCIPNQKNDLLHHAGFWMIVAGGLLIVIFVPMRLWMALVGAVLAVVGILIERRA